MRRWQVCVRFVGAAKAEVVAKHRTMFDAAREAENWAILAVAARRGATAENINESQAFSEGGQFSDGDIRMFGEVEAVSVWDRDKARYVQVWDISLGPECLGLAHMVQGPDARTH